MANPTRRRKTQPPTGRRKHQSSGEPRKLGKRSDVLQAEPGHAKLNLGDSDWKRRFAKATNAIRNARRRDGRSSRFRRVLFATDFSQASAKAFDTAVALAKASRATLMILHVIAPFTPIMQEQYVGTQTWEEIDLEGRASAKRELIKLTSKAKKAGIRATEVVAEGEPARQIVRVARSRKADLVVVGTHGRTGFTRFFLGSVATRVVATAQCPVVTVRGR
jgi:universal stress protein A